MRDNEQDRNDVIRKAKQYAIDDAVRNGAIRDTCTILDMAEVLRVTTINLSLIFYYVDCFYKYYNQNKRLTVGKDNCHFDGY